MEHEDIPLNEIHVAHNWEFANAAAREAASITSTSALKRLALQLDDKSMWMLVGVSPLTWVPVGGAVKADAGALAAHTVATNNPHSVTKAQVGLGNVDNTSDANKPVSTATQTALNAKADLSELALKANASDLDNHIADTNNPHSVTKDQVGLGNVDNTSDANKPVSTAQAAADALVLSQAMDYADSKVVSIFRDRGNYDASSDVFPSSGGSGEAGAIQTGDLWNITVAGTLGGESVDPRQTVRALVDDPGQTASNWAIGLASADIEDAINDGVTGRAPSQNAVFDALALKANTSSLDAHTANTSNPHGVTKAQVGLGNVDNTSDANKPISTATQAALDGKAGAIAFSDHLNDHANPHVVTKTQVGLGNVDNTSDANKPISTATQTALDTKAAAADLASHTGDTGNPHGVTKTQVGLSNVDNTSDANKPVSTAQQAAIDAKEPTIAAGTTAQYWRGDKSWQALDKAAVGLSNVDNTSDLDKPVSTAQQAAIDAKASDASVAAHINDTSNPHGVTKAQVGLSNVDNTSDAAKPISTATQTALDTKASVASLAAHTGDMNNPHGVDKADVGLGNVDNTSDINKPVSTAQAAADTTTLNAAKAYTDQQVTGIFRDRGNYDASSNAFPSSGGSGTSGAIRQGDLWTITVAGTLGGEAVDPRQTVRALVDNPGQTASNWAIGLANTDIEDAINDGVIGRAPSQNAVFDALALKASTTALNAHTGATNNPHSVTKAQVGLSNVDNTSDANKPVSTATQTALNAKEPTITAGTTSQYWRGDKTWATFAADVRSTVLTGIDTTINAVITATDGILSALGKLQKQITDNLATLTSHTSNTSNPHSTTKAQVGLSNVDNTSDANKPVSTATQTALNAKEPTIAAGTTAQYWRGDKSWQTLDKAAVGLGSVDNTSDAAKPIGTATQTALNAKEPTISAGTTSQYWRGDKTWQTLDASAVGALPLTGGTLSNNLGVYRVDASSNVSITNPSSTVARFPQFGINNYSGGFGGFPVIELRQSRGSEAAPVAVSAGDVLGGFNTWGHNGGSFVSATRIQGYAETAFSSAISAGVDFATTLGGVQGTRMRVGAAGRVMIGTTSDDGSNLLQVNGSAYANSIITGVANGVRLKTSSGSSGYGAILRNDGSQFHLLFTANNDANGTFNSLRPFSVSLVTGDVAMAHNLAISGTLFVGSRCYISGAVGTDRGHEIQTSGSTRWLYGVSAAAESGSNSGSNFFFNRYADNGSYIDTPMQLIRSTGQLQLGSAGINTTGTATSAKTATGQLAVRGGSGNEGGQIILGYGQSLTSGITDEGPNTWNIDVQGAGNNLRIFRINSSGASITPLVISESDGSIGTLSNFTVGGNLTVSGNLTLNGTTTTVNSTVTTLDDPVLTLGGDTAPTVDDAKDRGIEFRWHNGTSAKVGFFGFDRSTGRLIFIPDATNASEVFSGTVGTIEANVHGNVTGTAGGAPWSGITGTPTTRAGYGITDAEPSISAGTTAQYWRGDKTWQTHDKASVGLGNVDNTSDANKPVSTAMQTALNAKQDASTAVTLTGTQTLTNKTLTAPTITNATEGYTVVSVGAGELYDISINGGPNYEITITGNNPFIRLPAPVAGKRIYVDIIYTGAYTFAFAPISGQIRYSTSVPIPPQASAANRRDKYMFTAGFSGSVGQWFVTDLGRAYINVQ